MLLFRYLDKGILATVSATFAIFEKGRWRSSGSLGEVDVGIDRYSRPLWLRDRPLVLLDLDVERSWTRRGGARLIEDPS